MPLDKDSNQYTILFLVVMVVVVALSLSFVSSGLKPLKAKNEEIFTKKKILKSVLDAASAEEEVEMLTNEFVLSEYDSKIEELVIDADGNLRESDEVVWKIDFKKETRSAREEMDLPVFIYSEGSKKVYIVPMIGGGLWDEISGYLALNPDFNTIKGASFDHKAETPGLGAEMTEYWFRSQFKAKKLADSEGNYRFDILKGRGNKLTEFSVDGMSGATATSVGCEDMIAKITELYQPYFSNVKQANS